MCATELLRPPPPNFVKDRKVFFFDVDNTLYRKITGIGELMRDYIRSYIEENLHLDADEAEKLHQRYYKVYGLAIEGLVREMHVDAMDYNAKVDDKLPLENHLKPDSRLIEMFDKIDRTKWKLWLCTNAYRNHGLRVVRLLGIEKYFEGITYCDYERIPMICKPMPEFFETLMKVVGVRYDEEKHEVHPPCYFVDDSEANVLASEKFGWQAFHVCEPDGVEEPSNMLDEPLLPPLHEGASRRMKYILQLPTVVPELFRADQ